eukprot:scaffold130294_cov19-Tisochrysis_lutea.AAC.1
MRREPAVRVRQLSPSAAAERLMQAACAPRKSFPRSNMGAPSTMRKRWRNSTRAREKTIVV